MYAKLHFTPSCTNAQRNMSIVKLITDYYDPPVSVDFSGYPGIDSSRCQVISADSSHWTFAGVGGAQSLGSDSIGYSSGDAWHGSQYTLKTTYDTGHTQYADVKVMGNAEHANIYNGNQTETMIVPRNRFGTSIENRQCGNNLNTTDGDPDTDGQGVSHYALPEIHIFADQTKLALVGAQHDDINGYVFNGLFQFDRPSHMKYQDTQKAIGDSNVPCCWVLSGVGADGSWYNSSEQNTNAWSDRWDDRGEHHSFVNFPGNIYNNRTGTKFRNVALNGTNTNTWAGGLNHTIDDDTTQEPNAIQSTNTGGMEQYYTATTELVGYYPGNWFSLLGNHRYNYSSYVGDPDINLYNSAFGQAYIFDSNGNRAIPLKPALFDWHPFGGETVDMSAKAGIYNSIGGAGLWGDSAEVNGQKYQYFPTRQTFGLMIRRD